MERSTLALLGTQRKFWHRLSSPFAGLVLALSLAISNIPHPHLDAHAADPISMYKQVQIVDEATVPTAFDAAALENNATLTAQSGATFPENGIYLYGQVPEANQIGVSYAVMEINEQSAVGAFYMPHSSFDCFYGEVAAQQLNLTIINSYGQEAYAYSMPMTQQTTVASADGTPVSVPVLDGYHPIEQLSDVDHQILSTCRANYSKSI
jgi:hypothetical protein